MSASQKRRVQRMQRKFYSRLFVCVVLLMGIVLIHRLTLPTQAENDHEMYRYYTSVTVSSGDTLWSIADTYHTVECGDKRTYIREIKRLNHLATDDIHAGSSLVIPYYSADMKN